MSLIDSPKSWAPGTRERAAEFMLAIEYGILSEVASRHGPDSHGNPATELAEGRFGMRTGNPGR